MQVCEMINFIYSRIYRMFNLLLEKETQVSSWLGLRSAAEGSNKALYYGGCTKVVAVATNTHLYLLFMS